MTQAALDFNAHNFNAHTERQRLREQIANLQCDILALQAQIDQKEREVGDRLARIAVLEKIDACPHIDGLAEVLSGPYAGLDGIVTWTCGDSVWLRLNGDAVDLRFRRADVGPA